MITNEEQLNQAVEQLGRMYRALSALKREVLPVNARQFALLAEGPLDEIRKLEEAIDAYTGKDRAESMDRAIDVLESVQAETHVGDLREIDLDGLSFILRNAEDVREIRCSFEEDLLATVKEALDRRVQVTGTRCVVERRRAAPTLRVTRLEILDEDTAVPMAQQNVG